MNFNELGNGRKKKDKDENNFHCKELVVLNTVNTKQKLVFELKIKSDNKIRYIR